MKSERSGIKGCFIVLAGLAAMLMVHCNDAKAEGASIGGYDVAKIAASTLNVLKEKSVIAEPVEKEFADLLSDWPADPLALGPSFADFYSRLGAVLIEKNIASQKDVDNAATAAAQSGGIKIGGVNPVVLAASYLNILVQKGIITLPAAQSILDSSKIPQ